jgi:hypothetical protein
MQLPETAKQRQNEDPTKSMSHSDISDLLAACESAIDTANRSLAIARALAEGCRSSLRPPEDVIEAYLTRIDRDEANLVELRHRLAALKAY